MTDIINEFASLYKENGNDYDIDLEEYVIIEEGDWTQDHKYQYKTTIVMYKGQYLAINESRSGSYHSDWYYNNTYIYPVERKEQVVTTVSWPTIGLPVTVDSEF